MPNLPYNLRIGVTGHRNLQNVQAVRRAVETTVAQFEGLIKETNEHPGKHVRTIVASCDELLASCAARVLSAFRVLIPITPAATPSQRQTPVQWTIISPLAKGADRIVAEVVLAREHARLEVISPLPLDEYRKDFVDENDRAEFEQLLTLDPQPVILNAEYGETSKADLSTARKEAYFSVGRRVVDSCELLIAVWDGMPSSGRGGTGDVVHYALDVGRTVVWINAREPNASPRLLSKKAGSDVTLGPLPGMWHRPLPSRAKGLSLGFHRLAAYQRDNAYNEKLAAKKADSHAVRLAQIAEAAGLPYAAVEPVIDQLVPQYARADQMATLYQGLYVFAAKALFRLSAIAVTIVVFQLLFFPHALWLILFEIAAMLSAVLLLRISRREAWHEKWLNDRHLAEWLRSKMFTVIAGGPPCHRPNTVTLPFYQGPDNWHMDAFGPVLAEVQQRVPQGLPLNALKQFVIDDWINQQAEWHASNAQKKKESAHSRHRIAMALFYLTLLMALLHFLGVGHGEGHDSAAEVPHHAAASSSGAITEHAKSSNGHQHAAGDRFTSNFALRAWLWNSTGLWITLLAIVLPVWGAAVHAVNNLLEYERIAERSANMAQALALFASRAAEAKSPEALRNVVGEVEQLMATENHEWLVSLSFRSLNSPGF